MNRRRIGILAALTTLMAPVALQAQTSGFESGTAGYSGTGNTGTSPAGTNIAPVTGSYFGYVATDPTGCCGTLTSDPFSIAAGGTISFWANFLTAEGIGSYYNDFAYVRLLDAVTNGVVSTLGTWNTASTSSGSASFAGMNFSSQTGWSQYVSTVATAGTYRLEFFTSDYGDQIVPSALAFDDVQVGETVTPEPVSMALLGTGLAGLGAVRRRRRKPDAV